MSLLELFCNVDDFYQGLTAWSSEQQLTNGRKRGPRCRLSEREVMTLVIHFHESDYRTFKRYYCEHVCKQLSDGFPALVSYNRFVERISKIFLALCAYLQQNFGEVTGISFVDSTPIAVCPNKRIKRNKVFAGLAARGCTSMGWFYGFKLPLIINDKGELLSVYLTPGNTDDRKPLETMTQNLFGKLFGDKGYLSQPLFEKLYEQGLELISTLRSNMKNSLMRPEDKILLRKRFLIETVNDQLKNISQIEHSRHRSPSNFAINLIAGLITYQKQPKKPSLNLQFVPENLPVII